MTASAQYPSLVDRSVLITGGATGIGATLVERFVAQGARVGFLDIDEAAGSALAARLAAGARHAPLFVRADLTDIAALRAAIDRVRAANGPITVLLNNAANDQRHSIEQTTPESWDAGVAVNLRHQFFAAQHVAPDMRAAGGGSIVNFGSISWMNAEGNYPAYTASKAAVHGLTRGLARDFGPDNIRVNTLVPGWIMTERQVALWLDADGERQIQENQCLKRKLYPPDIARMVLFLAADDSENCTAQNFVVDAGWT